MSWVRLDDGFIDHPKVVQAGDKEFRLFIAGLLLLQSATD
jgi:hypothetical protein